MTVVERSAIEKSERARQLDIFVEKVLDALYELGLMPLGLGKKPAQYEKYPQELLAMLEAKGDVETAFTEWQAKLLRKPRLVQVREQGFAKLNALHAWMLHTDTQSLLSDKALLRHLRRSMFGRTYAYLFTRLSLIMQYRDYCQGEGLVRELWIPEGGREKQYLRAVSDREFIEKYFAEATKSAYNQLADLWGIAEAMRLRDQAISFLLLNYRYFNTWFTSKDDMAASTNETVEE